MGVVFLVPFALTKTVLEDTFLGYGLHVYKLYIYVSENTVFLP
jgi:hypothetical protein